MKLGYGTYGMKQLDIFDVLHGLKTIGYDHVEFTVAEGWPTEPKLLTKENRRRLAAHLQALGFPPPVLMDLISPCVTGEQRKDMMKKFLSVCELAQDLNYENNSSVVTFTLGGQQPEWETGKNYIAECLLELADIAENFGVIIAIEPHIGGALDTPYKAVWLMERTNHRSLKLNFDISHFAVQGMDTRECVQLCAPYAVHCHIKDGSMENGKLQFMLPGQGEFNLTDYFNALREVSFQLPVTVEVSGMVWSQPDYDPWAAARSCYTVLNEVDR